jgi:hypothetical protein
MSDHEFENYLALLSRLLRLSGKQRGQIAEELRAHLDDRLEELTAQGVSREEAVRRALEEFGDAAGLAGQFATIASNRKRRWLMRLTTFSVAATFLVGAGLAVLWPGRNAAPGVAVVVAQARQAADPADPFSAPPAVANPADPFAPSATNKAESKTAKANEKSSAAARIAAELDRITEIDAVEMPLRDVVTYFSERHNIPIVLKTRKLDEASISVDSPVTKQLRGIRLSSALNLILEDLDLTYLVKDEVLQITSIHDAQAAMEIHIYDCRDILAMPGPGQGPLPGGEGAAGGFGPAPGVGGPGGAMVALGEHDRRAAQLMTILTTNVDPRTWQAAIGAYGGVIPGGGMVGGIPAGGGAADVPLPGSGGTISEYNGLIVVTQTAQTHKKIEHVLEMLREAAGLDAAKAGKVVR